MGQMMNRFLAILERDLRKFIRNPIVVAVSVLMPILYLVILGSSFQGELKNLPVAVVDRDNGPYARRVFDLLRSIEAGPKTIKIKMVSDEGFAMEGLREGVFKAVIIIPENFSREVIKEAGPKLGLFLDNSDIISAKTVHAVVSSAVPELKREFVPVRERDGVPLSAMDVYRKIDYDQTLIPGVVIMAIFLGAMTTGAFNLVMDRFLGTDESYFLTPLTKGDIVAGLIVSGLIITTLTAIIVLFISSLISGIYLWRTLDAGRFLLTVAVIVLSTLGLQGLMFIVMGRINHPRIVGVLAFATVNPETYSVHALKSILFKGAGFGAIAMDMAALAVFAFVLILLGIITFKRSL
ncbi:MAG: ABC transporter permease [Deltaproteobacteria bacterium]|nr:ABC transporter permease [Deltaproteobacteria bacterium]